MPDLKSRARSSSSVWRVSRKAIAPVHLWVSVSLILRPAKWKPTITLHRVSVSAPEWSRATLTPSIIIGGKTTRKQVSVQRNSVYSVSLTKNFRICGNVIILPRGKTQQNRHGRPQRAPTMQRQSAIAKQPISMCRILR